MGIISVLENFVVRRVSVASLSFSICFAVLTCLLAAQEQPAVDTQIVVPPVAPKVSSEPVQEIVPEIVDAKPQDPAAPAIKKKIRSEYVLPCLLYTSPSPRDRQKSRMPSSA